MKKSHIAEAMMLFLLLASCTGFEDTETTDDGITELSLGTRVSGAVETVGNVDWFHYRAVEANSILKVNGSSNTYRPDVDLLVTVFEEDSSGNRTRIAASHAPEDSQLPADIQMNVYIDRPKDVYISVRDLMDDDSSDYPYYLSVDFAGQEEGNETFSDAIPLVVDDPSTCHTDHIDSIGDVDCFRFTVAALGVYGVQVDFTPFAGGTDVELSIDLYNSDGLLVASLERAQSYQYHLLPYLTPDEYYAVIDDYGRNDFDSSSPYEICVTSVAADEANANDTQAEADLLVYDPSSDAYAASGSLGYLGDTDWYRIPLADVATAGFKVLQVGFDDGEEQQQMDYQLDLLDEAGTILLSHRFSGGSSPFTTQIRAGSGDHFLQVQPYRGQHVTQSAPYTLAVEVLDIEDPAETVEKVHPTTGETVLGNDTIDTADVLGPTSDPNAATIAKIGYRGDEDWYAVVIDDPTAPRILEVFLDTDGAAGLVDYGFSIMRDQVVKRLYDATGEDGGTDLRTSILVQATQMASPLTYYVRVYDFQGDDGDGQVPYRIRVNVADIPAALPADSLVLPAEAIYYSEAAEQEDAFATVVSLEMNSLTQKSFRAETTSLDFNRADPISGITKTVNADETVTIEFPWLAGYVDYQGDQDWFRLDLGPLVQVDTPLDTDWYYDIQVDMHVDAPGSSVEYVWKLYRDRNSNRILVDRPNDSDGFFASAGDEDTAVQPLDLSEPQSDSARAFWVGDAWEGPFYLSISDFNYVASPQPDDDWGYGDVPYYVRLTLVYYPGVSYP